MGFLSNFSEGQKNFGLLVLRLGIGFMFIMHGYPKLIAGPEKWEKLGKAMSLIGVDFMPVMWGFMAGLAEAGGGLLLILGILFRPACLVMCFTMVIAALKHIDQGDGIFTGASHAIELGIVFFSLFFIGPGQYRLKKMVIE
ncbi:MAG: hypothetical protein KatS3mg031_0551 [Chitinophagales bacterium]|nr:MAG: hypothetical protein KatS3mg031_0551 [Chitinophagales bacterium]